MKRIGRILLVLIAIIVLVGMCYITHEGGTNYRYNGVEDVYK